MSVKGIGTDIVDIERLVGFSGPALAKLAKRVLTDEELIRYNNMNFPIPFLAKRWAAKEAAAKALGTGIAAGISFQHIQINNLDSGQPVLVFSGEALKRAKSLSASSWHVSLSDEKKYATAFVVLSA